MITGAECSHPVTVAGSAADTVVGVSNQPTVIELQLRWGDMDPLEHTNNVMIARLIEEARVRALDIWFGSGRRAGIGLLVARQEIEFVASLLYSVEPARCEVWCSRIGGKSAGFGCRLLAADGTVAALAETTLAVVDRDTGRPTPIDDELRELLAAHSGDPVPFRARRQASSPA